MINKHHRSWRKAMPKYYDLNWESQKLKAFIRPIGIRGWPMIRKLIPYVSGDIMHLNLFEKKLDNKEREFNYDWNIWYSLPNGRYSNVKRMIGSFASKSHKSTKHNFGTFLIGSPGHYLCQLELNTTENDEKPIKKTMLIFDALAGDIWRTDIALRALIGVIGGLVGAALTLLITS